MMHALSSASFQLAAIETIALQDCTNLTRKDDGNSRQSD